MTVATRTADKPDTQATAAAVAAEKAKQPKTANEVLARVDEDHTYTHDPIDMNSTGGIQKATERNWKAIQALADFVDGKK